MGSVQTHHLTEMIQAAHLTRDPYAGFRRRRFADDPDAIDGLDEDESEDDDVDIPLSVLQRPRGSRYAARAQSFPPMPDLRFEQSYLNSIANAKTWWHVAWITIRDQVLMPLAQGVLYNLALLGWQHWNRNARMSGSSAGARLRRWWYHVNKWPLPERAFVRKS